MDFNIIILMGLFIMANGNPPEERFHAQLLQPPFQSPFITPFNGFNMIWKPLPPFQWGFQDHKPPVPTNFATGVIHSEQTASNVLNRPHKVIYGNPVPEEFIDVECNPSFNLSIKQQSDPVQSDFSSSKLAVNLNLEESDSSSEDDLLGSASTPNPQSSNSSSANNNSNVVNGLTSETEEFDDNEANDFELVAEKEIDPVQSDFSANKLASGHTDSSITSNGFVTVISNLETTTVPSNLNKSVEKGVVDATPVTISSVVTITSSEGNGSLNNSGSNNVKAEIDNGPEDEGSVTTATINTPQQTQDTGMANITEEEEESSTEEVPCSCSDVDEEEPAEAESTSSSNADSGTHGNVTLGEMSSSVNSVNEQGTAGKDNGNVNVINQSAGNEMVSGGNSVTSTSVNGQEPIAIVTPYTPIAVDDHSSTSGSFVNGEQPVTIVWAINPNNTEPLGIQDSLVGGQTSSGSFSVYNSSSHGEKHRTVVSSQPQNGQEPITIVTAVSPTQFQEQLVGGEATSVLSDSEIGQDLVTVMNASNVTSGMINEMANKLGNNFTGNQILVESSVSVDSINGLKPVHSVLGGQIHNQIRNTTSESSGEEEPLMATSNHTTITTQNDSKPLGEASSDTGHVPEQKPVMISSGGQIPTGSFNQMQNQFFNRSMEGQMAPSMFDGFGNQQKQPTSDFFNHMTHQWAMDMGNKPAEHQNYRDKPITTINTVTRPQGETSNSFVAEHNSTTASTGGNIPLGFNNHMQNQFFNRPMGGQMFPPFYGGFANQQRPSTSNFLNYMADQFSMNMENRPGEQQAHQHHTSIGTSTIEQNPRTPTMVSNSAIGSQTQNHFANIANEPMGGHFQSVMPPTGSGGNIPTGFNNQMQNQYFNRPMGGQMFQPPTSDFYNHMTHQWAMNMGNKPVGQQAGSSSSSVNQQNPVGGQIQNQITNTANNHMETKPSTLFGNIDHAIATTGHVQNQHNNRPLEGTSSSSFQNQFFNRPMGGQTIPPFFNGFINQQQPTSEFFNHITDQLAMPNIPGGHPVAQHIGNQMFEGSSVNGQEPITVLTNIKPAPGQITQHTDKPMGSHISIGNSVSTSSINGKVTGSGVSVSSSSVNGQDPITGVANFNPISGQITEQTSNKPIGSHISLGNSVSTSSVNGHVTGSGVSVSSSSVNGQDPITVVTNFNPVSGQIIQETSNKPIGNHISIGNSASTGSVGIITNSQAENGQVSGSGVSVSSNSMNGEEPIRVSSIINPVPIQNQAQEKVSFVGSSASSSIINGQKHITGNDSKLQSGQVSFSGISMSSSSINGHKPISSAVITNSAGGQVENQIINGGNKPTIGDISSVQDTSTNGTQSLAVTGANNGHIGELSSEHKPSVISPDGNTSGGVFNQVQNQFFNKPSGVQTFPPFFNGFANQQQPAPGFFSHTPYQPGYNMGYRPGSSSSSSNVLNHVSPFGNPHFQTGQTSFSGVSGSSSTINGKEPVTIITNNDHAVPSAFDTTILDHKPVGEHTIEMQNQFLNRPMGAQTFPPFFNGFNNQQQHGTGIFNQISDHMAANTGNKPGGQHAFVGSSIQSSSFSDGQKTQTIVTSTDSLTGKVTQTKYESVGGKPVTVFQSVSSSVDGDKGQTVITSNNPITGEVSQTKYESSSVKKLPQGFNDSSGISGTITLEPENLTHSTTTDDGIETELASPSSDLVNNTETGGFNQMNDQLAAIKSEGSTSQSSSSSDGQNTHTTDRIAGKVTQMKYQSSEGKPVAVFQSISSVADGEKTETAIPSNNPITGEISQSNNDSSSVKNLPQGFDESSDTITLEPESSTHSTIDDCIETELTSSSTDHVNNIGTGNKVKEEHGSKSFDEIPPSSANNATIHSIEQNSSMNEAIGLSVLHHVGGEQISASPIFSTIAETPVTILFSKNPSIGAHRTNSSSKLISQKGIVPSGTTTPLRSSRTKEIWRKRKYSIINFDKPIDGRRLLNSNFKPLGTSTNSRTGKVNLIKLKILSGVNRANVPVNTRLSSRYRFYPQEERVLKRVKLWAL